MSPLWIAGENHFVVSPAIGQLCTFDELNAYRQMIADRDVEEREHERDPDAERDACAARLHQSASNAPSRRAITR